MLWLSLLQATWSVQNYKHNLDFHKHPFWTSSHPRANRLTKSTGSINLVVAYKPSPPLTRQSTPICNYIILSTDMEPRFLAFLGVPFAPVFLGGSWKIGAKGKTGGRRYFGSPSWRANTYVDVSLENRLASPFFTHHPRKIGGFLILSTNFVIYSDRKTGVSAPEKWAWLFAPPRFLVQNWCRGDAKSGLVFLRPLLHQFSNSRRFWR